MWTDERRAELVRLWNEGKTALEIGKEWGISRSAVIGQIYRMRKVGGETIRSVVRQVRLRDVTAREGETPERAPLNGDVTDREGCRYVLGDPGDDDWHYCGKKRKSGSSYCAHHHGLCYHLPRVSVRELERGIRKLER